MRSYQIQGKFGLDNLVASERGEPSPGPGEVLVQVRAASLNFRDLMMVKGLYNPRQPLPLIPCSDGAGEVLEVGAGVELKVGERVASVLAPGWPSGAPTRQKLAGNLGGPADGMLAERRVLPESALLPVPEGLSFEEASTLPCAAVTAWRALITEGQLAPGQTVLLQGTGGVSIFGLQIARLVGARVLITSSQDQKLERAKALGAAAGINYRTTPDWGKAAKALTGGVGVDHVLDVGGAGTLDRSLQAVRMGGMVSVIGVLDGGAGAVNLIPVLMQNLRLQGILVGSRDDQAALFRAFALASVRPVIDRVFGFDEVGAAFEHLQAGRHFGKVVIRVS